MQSQPDPAAIWIQTLERLTSKMTKPNFDTFLSHTAGVAFDGGEFVISAPNAFVARAIEGQMYTLIVEELVEIVGRDVRVRFTVDGLGFVMTGPTPSGIVEPDSLRDQRSSGQLPDPAAAGLDPKYTFDDYVVGPQNRIAHSAALRVIERPGREHNPLVVHSMVGLGKTHLLQAIGNALFAQGRNVLYATTERFGNDFVQAIRPRGDPEQFRMKYRTLDVLLLDDVQFLIGKESFAEEFYFTFNELHLKNRQIILALDRHPRSLRSLEDRVRSRLASGLAAPIGPPDLETRVAYIAQLLEKHDWVMRTEAMYELARTAETYRGIQANFSLIVASAQIEPGEITPILIQQHLSDLDIVGGHSQPTVDEIIYTTALAFGFAPEELLGQKRTRSIVSARQIAMYLLRKKLDLSMRAIAAEFRRKSPNIASLAIKEIESSIDQDPALRAIIANVEHSLTTSTTY